MCMKGYVIGYIRQCFNRDWSVYLRKRVDVYVGYVRQCIRQSVSRQCVNRDWSTIGHQSYLLHHLTENPIVLRWDKPRERTQILRDGM